MKGLLISLAALSLAACSAPSNNWVYPTPVSIHRDDYDLTASIPCIEVLGQKQCTDFNIQVKNKTNKAIKIVWNDSALAWSGNSSQLLPDGIKYIEATQSKPDTVIPPGMTITKIVTPSSNVYFDSLASHSWQKKLITPNSYNLYLQMDVGGERKAETLQMDVKQGISR